MVNQKRVEQKLPLLLTDGPWYSGELDRNAYLMRKFKRTKPDLYATHLNDILSKLQAVQKDIDPKLNGNGKR
jgi:hypothetical protein